jgi:ADP-ribose pyrophosphatase YjhB (NUDIX family)
MKWKDPAVPRSVVQLLVLDSEGRILLMHRSNKVRSARNVWSIPSGLQEIGETLNDTAIRELKEEFNLSANRLQLLGYYENIAGDSESYCKYCDVPSGQLHMLGCQSHEHVQEQPQQYHWVITVLLACVDTLTTLVNNEPDKHDQVVIAPYTLLQEDNFLSQYKFHPTFTQFFNQYSKNIVNHIEEELSDI